MDSFSLGNFAEREALGADFLAVTLFFAMIVLRGFSALLRPVRCHYWRCQSIINYGRSDGQLMEFADMEKLAPTPLSDSNVPVVRLARLDQQIASPAP